MPPEQALHFWPYRLTGPRGPLGRGAQVVPVPPFAHLDRSRPLLAYGCPL
jgi:hypothetical protein